MISANDYRRLLLEADLCVALLKYTVRFSH